MTDARSATEQDGSPPAQAAWLTVGLRYVLPGVVVLGGLVVMAFGSEADLEGGAGIVSAGLAVYAMSWLYRASVDGDRVREQEEAAREYYGVHGRWPDEVPASELPPPPLAPGSGQAAPGPRAPAQRGPGAIQTPRRAHAPLRPRRPGGSQ
jgi:hypothetical protein